MIEDLTEAPVAQGDMSSQEAVDLGHDLIESIDIQHPSSVHRIPVLPSGRSLLGILPDIEFFC